MEELRKGIKMSYGTSTFKKNSFLVLRIVMKPGHILRDDENMSFFLPILSIFYCMK